MKRNQKGSSSVVIIIAIIVVLAAIAFYLLVNRTTTPSPYQNNQSNQQKSTSSNQSIQSDSDLMNASNELDNTDVDGSIDPQLNQNDTDAQTFAPRIRLKNGTSSNWSGYAIETNLTNPQSNAVNDVKGSWVVPSLTCTSTNTYSATWVGIDGYSDNSVEQTGTEQDCISGQPRYYGWYEMYPKPSFRVNLPVKAGDTMSAEVQYTGGKQSQFVLTLTNVTTGQTFTTKQHAKVLRQSAEWIVEAPWSGGVLPLANFGTVAFSNAQATLGTVIGTINNAAWQNDAITMTTSSGTAKATPSALSADGSSFTITWNSN